ncbi:MAG: amidohydrolase family protein [Agriterribacter sp.]
MKIIYLLLYGCVLLSCTHKLQTDLIVHHAKVYTVDSTFSIAEAIAVKDGKIVEAGNNQRILDTYTAKEMIDAKGKIMYPGFIDGHAHFYSYGLSLKEVNLVGTKSWDECIERSIAFAKQNNIQPGTWLTGNGWDQNDWTDKNFPDKQKLDEAFPATPVLLSRIDGHAAIANQAALDKAGIKAGDTLRGGVFETKDKKLTGILIDNAVGSVSSIIPSPKIDILQKLFKQAEHNCFAVGLTGVMDCGLAKATVNELDSMQKTGNLKMKLTVLLSDAEENYDYYLSKTPYQSDRMRIAGFKLYADGALGSRGACLLQPYNDKKGWNGFLLSNVEHYTQVLKRIYNSPYQACVHAIGDSANRMILQQFATILQNKNDRRWRIEHAQVVDAANMEWFGKYNVIPSVQPTHATSDMYWAGERLGTNRIKTAYAYKQLFQQNGWIVLGTDFPVEDISPFKTFYAAVVRKDATGFPANGFQIENALTREQALRGITIWAARGSFEETQKGSIEKGKWADFILVDTDIMQCKDADILKSKVIATYINGEKVY